MSHLWKVNLFGWICLFCTLSVFIRWLLLLVLCFFIFEPQFMNEWKKVLRVNFYYKLKIVNIYARYECMYVQHARSHIASLLYNSSNVLCGICYENEIMKSSCIHTQTHTRTITVVVVVVHFISFLFSLSSLLSSHFLFFLPFSLSFVRLFFLFESNPRESNESFDRIINMLNEYVWNFLCVCHRKENLFGKTKVVPTVYLNNLNISYRQQLRHQPNNLFLHHLYLAMVDFHHF